MLTNVFEGLKNKLIKADNIFFHPIIPAKKIDGVRSVYGSEVSKENILILIDDTVFGGAKEGMVITNDALYFKAFMQNGFKVDFSQIEALDVKGDKLFINGVLKHSFTIVDKKNLSILIEDISKALTLKKDVVSPNKQINFFDIPSNPLSQNFYQYKSDLLEVLNNLNQKENLIQITRQANEFALGFATGYPKSPHYNQFFERIINDDLSVFYAQIWCLVCVRYILKLNEFNSKDIDEVLSVMIVPINYYMFLVESDNLNTLAAKANMQAALKKTATYDFLECALRIWGRESNKEEFLHNFSSLMINFLEHKYRKFNFDKYSKQFEKGGQPFIDYCYKYASSAYVKCEELLTKYL